jgi:hypothetical protein
MSITILNCSELTSNYGSGVVGDIKVQYKFASETGVFDVGIEYKSSSGYWASCLECAGTIGPDISATVANTITCFWKSKEQYGSAETNVNLRIVSIK